MKKKIIQMALFLTLAISIHYYDIYFEKKTVNDRPITDNLDCVLFPKKSSIISIEKPFIYDLMVFTTMTTVTTSKPMTTKGNCITFLLITNYLLGVCVLVWIGLFCYQIRFVYNSIVEIAKFRPFPFVCNWSPSRQPKITRYFYF